MKDILKEIQTGAFAREWVLENRAGTPLLDSLRKKGREHPIEEVGERLRKLMKL